MCHGYFLNECDEMRVCNHQCSLEFNLKSVHPRKKLDIHQNSLKKGSCLHLPFCLKSPNPKRQGHVLIITHTQWNLNPTAIFHMAFLILLVPCTFFTVVFHLCGHAQIRYFQHILLRGKRVAAVIYTDNRTVCVSPAVL